MANLGFNASTISFNGGDQIPLRDINYTDAAAEVQVTGSADSEHSYEAGISDPTVTYTIVGGSGLAIGAEAAVAIAWFDGTTDALTNGVCTNRATSGSIDSELLTAVTVRPTAA